MKNIIPIVLLIFFAAGPLAAQNQSPEKEVLQVVQSLFDAMAKADSSLAAPLFMEDGHTYAVQSAQGNQLNVSLSSHQQFLNSIAGWEPGSIKEKMWDATVMVQGNIAMVWAPYNLHVNGNFSHCGINLLSLINTADGWKIADITYSVKRQGCTDSSAETN